jgi:hypothetical protein
MSYAIVLAGLLVLALSGQQAMAQSGEMAGHNDKDQLNQAAMIRAALRAAPPSIAKTATVIDAEGNTLRKGTGTFTCMPLPDPMCLDEQWMTFGTAWMKKETPQVTKVGIGYMLDGDRPDGGGSNKDPFATAATPDNDWVIEGPHLMILVPDTSTINHLPTDPNSGSPYVMWKGTPYAHIMLPVAERPAQ